ncbi:Cobalt transport protein [Bacillus cereus BDRD-ST26]|nr:Cobalt transport protein [Bacillus cereus BDRD-ST26]
MEPASTCTPFVFWTSVIFCNRLINKGTNLTVIIVNNATFGEILENKYKNLWLVIISLYEANVNIIATSNNPITNPNIIASSLIRLSPNQNNVVRPLCVNNELNKMSIKKKIIVLGNIFLIFSLFPCIIFNITINSIAPIKKRG